MGFQHTLLVQGLEILMGGNLPLVGLPSSESPVQECSAALVPQENRGQSR